ncbi:MAG TPA: transporter [Eubacteriaceae bacterium]|nr:transporter [Eubacteriaceae bacterium]
MNFYDIFTSIFTLFALGITGYVIRKMDLLKKTTTENIPLLITHVTLPALVIAAMQIPFSWDRVGDIFDVLFVAGAGYVVQLGIAFVIPYLLGVRNQWDKGVYQFMVVFSNAAFMGFPVLMSIYGSDAVFYGAIFNMPFNALVFTIGVFFMEKGKSTFSPKQFVSPALVATFLGLLFFSFNVQIPQVIFQPLEMIGNLTTPLSMLFIGASLSEIRIGSTLKNKKLYIISLFRLILSPMVVLFLMKNLVSDPVIRGIPVILNAMPVAALCAILAKTYDNNVDLASEGIFVTTFFSMFTIPLIVMINGLF